LLPKFTPAEKGNVSKILGRAVEPEDTLTLDGVHGLLFGLAVIPESIMPSEWFPRIFGAGMAEFAEKDDVETWMGSLLGAYNRVLGENEEGKLEFPFDMTDLREGDFERIRHWAFGLFRAMSLRPETWGFNKSESAIPAPAAAGRSKRSAAANNARLEVFPAKTDVAAFPPARFSFHRSKTVNSWFTVGRKNLAKSVFPDEVKKKDGFVLRKPNHWQ